MKKISFNHLFPSKAPIFILLLLFFSNHGYCAENVSSSPEPKLKIIEEKTNIKDIFYFINGKWTNLTNYKSPNHIYDYRISPDGNYAFIWHMEYSPRLLSIYGLSKLVLLKELKLGFGGELKWTTDNNIVHVYGCGSGCTTAKVIDREGEILFEIGGSPVEVSPSGRYLLFFTMNWIGKQNFELYDLSHQYLMSHKTPLFTIAGVGNVDSIRWNDEKLITIKYTDVKFADASSEKETYIKREISIDLSKY
jgi:hypothetical protein